MRPHRVNVRFSDEEWEALERARRPGERVSDAMRRIVLNSASDGNGAELRLLEEILEIVKRIEARSGTPPAGETRREKARISAEEAQRMMIDNIFEWMERQGDGEG